MVSAVSSALSGLSAATQRLNVSAQNIANSTTPGYKSQELVQSSNNLGGVNTSVQSTGQPVDTAQQLVNANISSYTAQGNLSVIKVQNNLFKSLLNIVS